MLPGATGTATIPQREKRGTSRRKKETELIQHLREVAQQHQICYEIWPVWSSPEKLGTQVGFELLLCGVGRHVVSEGASHAVPCCQRCAHTYSELRQIAEWVLRLKTPPSGHKIHAFDCALHLAPPRRLRRSEIVITTLILHEFDPQSGRDHRESDCLKEVRERLSKLGISEDVLCPSTCGNA